MKRLSCQAVALRRLVLCLCLSTLNSQLSTAWASGDTPLKNAKVSGTSAVVSGTLSISSGVAVTFLAGSTLDVSLGTLTLADNQVPWAKVNKSGSSFLNLGDTPSSYVSQALKVVRVNSGATGLEFGVAPAGDFLGLTDTPSSYTGQAGKVATVNGTENGLIFSTASSGASTFLGLTDTPASYTGAGGNFIKVNSGATGVEFVAAGSAPYARVYNSTAISTTSGTGIALTFDSERADTENIHSTTSNTSRLTCVTPGRYIITGYVAFDVSATGRREASIVLNGGQSITFSSQNGVAAQYEGMPVTATYDLAAGDYVTLTVYQNSGGALNIVSAGKYSPEFSMVKVGDSTTSGGAFTQVFSDAGTSLTNWTSVSGTWVTTSGNIEQTNNAQADHALKLNTNVPLTTSVVSVDVQFTGTQSSATYGGFTIFNGTSASGYLGYGFEGDASGITKVELGNNGTSEASAAFASSYSAWHTLTVRLSQNRADFYADGAFISSLAKTPTNADGTVLGLYSYGSHVLFRNIKVSTPTLP